MYDPLKHFYFQKNKKQKNEKNILLILPLVLFLNSCKKENVSVQTDKEKIIAEIGFDLKTVDFNNISAASKIAPLKFESVEEASKYFKILAEDLKDPKDLRKIIANDKLLSDSKKSYCIFYLECSTSR